MKTVKHTITTDVSTDIYVGRAVLGKLDKILKPYGFTGYVLLCDSYTKKLIPRFASPVHIYEIARGEESKDMNTVLDLVTFMSTRNFDRKSAIVALGGGVVGDVATLAASLYYRGIACVQVPTTLLSQVDSSIGGKGGVNVAKHKNTLGVIYQPRVIVVDTTLPLSLPEKQFRSGLGEIVKYAIAMDNKLFEKLEKTNTFDPKSLEEIIAHCIKLKMDIVKKDPFDTKGIRQIFNFGHTLGQAIELETNLLHGEAISIGMAMAIRLSTETGLLSKEDGKRALALLSKYHLPTKLEQKISLATIEKALTHDKKAISGTPRFVLLKRIGLGITNQEVPAALVRKALTEIIA